MPWYLEVRLESKALLHANSCLKTACCFLELISYQLLILFVCSLDLVAHLISSITATQSLSDRRIRRRRVDELAFPLETRGELTWTKVSGYKWNKTRCTLCLVQSPVPLLAHVVLANSVSCGQLTLTEFFP